MGSTARASAKTSTLAAAARFSARAQASGGCSRGNHVVHDDDFLPFDAAGPRSIDLEGPGDVAAPLLAVGPTWLAVRRTRLSTKQSTGWKVRRPTAWASMADWLNRRHHSLEG